MALVRKAQSGSENVIRSFWIEFPHLMMLDHRISSTAELGTSRTYQNRAAQRSNNLFKPTPLRGAA